MTRLDYTRAKRIRREDYAETPLYDWHPRQTKFEARCTECGGPVLPGPALMRKAGERWQAKHRFHSTT